MVCCISIHHVKHVPRCVSKDRYYRYYQGYSQCRSKEVTVENIILSIIVLPQIRWASFCNILNRSLTPTKTDLFLTIVL